MKKSSQSGRGYGRLEEVVGCKWSVSVLLSIRSGVNRPGALEREITGISTRILNVRLRKLTACGLLQRTVFDEQPPHTEYALTPEGGRLVGIIAQLRALDGELGMRSA